MRYLIDNQTEKVKRRMQSPLVMGQLLTPLTGYSDWGGEYAIDNGAFSRFPVEKFKRLLNRQINGGQECLQRCIFVTCPDIVGNARRTMEIWRNREMFCLNSPHIANRMALVAQNGIENFDIDWKEFRTMFIGGRDPWKDSSAVADLVKTAKSLGIWVHVGRVNTPKRFEHFFQLGADSCDGNGVGRYDHMLEKIEKRHAQNPEPTDRTRFLFDAEEDCEKDQDGLT